MKTLSDLALADPAARVPLVQRAWAARERELLEAAARDRAAVVSSIDDLLRRRDELAGAFAGDASA
jgi:hypothetical protein